MKNTIAFFLMLITAAGLLSQANGQSGSGFKMNKSFHIASAGGWDYISVGPSNNRLYVSHGAQVNILDEQTGDSVGVILNTAGVHGIAFDSATGKGYTSNGRLNTVSVFDLKTNAVVSEIPTGQNPDAIMYDPYSDKVITCNGRSKDLSIIDPASNKVVATIPVGGKPETAVSDGAGKIYVNIEDKNEIAVVNMQTNKVDQRWSITPGESPTGLAIDNKTKRLFAGCEKLLIVIDITNGKIIGKLPIGDGCDGVAFDSNLNNIYASCGEGVLSIIHEISANEFSAAENIPTKRSARTLAIDEHSHEIFLPAADFEKAVAGTERPKMIPGTFQVIVVSK